jgi:hypothetical protein
MIMSAGDLQETFVRGAEVFDFVTEVIPKLHIILNLIKASLTSDVVKDKLRLVTAVPTSCHLWGHKAFITEALFNLISNAVEEIEEDAVLADPSRARIELSIAFSDEGIAGRFVKIGIRDFARGFKPKPLELHQLAANRLVSSTPESFWNVLDELLEEIPLAGKNQEEHMGVGLLFCAAYLRSFEWDESVRRSGRLEIDSTQGKGATVSMFLPLRSTEVYK